MPVNKLVSVNHVLVNLMDSMGLEHNKYKPMFINWATQAEKEIGSFYQYQKKIKVLEISGCVAELPCDAKVLQLALLGDFGCDCEDLFNRVGLNATVTSGDIESVSFLVVDLSASEIENGTFGTVKFHVQDNKLILDRNLDGESITVQYLGLVTDEEGIPKVMENHLLAIEAYCRYKFQGRSIRSGIDVGMYREYKGEWNQLVCSARADDAELSENDRADIIATINNPLSGRSLNLIGYAL
jgi:hypothetical protein